MNKDLANHMHFDFFGRTWDLTESYDPSEVGFYHKSVIQVEGEIPESISTIFSVFGDVVITRICDSFAYLNFESLEEMKLDGDLEDAQMSPLNQHNREVVIT